VFLAARRATQVVSRYTWRALAREPPRFCDSSAVDVDIALCCFRQREICSATVAWTSLRGERLFGLPIPCKARSPQCQAERYTRSSRAEPLFIACSLAPSHAMLCAHCELASV
jgi:hypothetical protein